MNNNPKTKNIIYHKSDEVSTLDQFLDEKGKVIEWPIEFYLQDYIVGYLGGKFNLGKEYTKPETLEIIDEWSKILNPQKMLEELVIRELLDKNVNNNTYKITDDILDFAKPSKYVDDLLPYLESGSKILDIGTADGRNILPFLEMGAYVDALDNNSEFIDALNIKYADYLGGQLNPIICDITKDFPKVNYDLIICSMVLHFFDETTSNQVVENMISNTKLGGVNYISMFSSNNNPGRRPFMPEDDYLRKEYEDWEKIIDTTEYSYWYLMDGKYRRTNNRIFLALKK